MVMRRNLALTGRATSGLIGRPRGGGKRRIQQSDYKQANARNDGTTAVLTRSLHVAREPVYVVRHYSVDRHSLQAYSTTLSRFPHTIRQSRKSLTRGIALGRRALLRSPLT